MEGGGELSLLFIYLFIYLYNYNQGGGGKDRYPPASTFVSNCSPPLHIPVCAIFA